MYCLFQRHCEAGALNKHAVRAATICRRGSIKVGDDDYAAVKKRNERKQVPSDKIV